MQNIIFKLNRQICIPQQILLKMLQVIYWSDLLVVNILKYKNIIVKILSRKVFRNPINYNKCTNI